MDLYDNEDSVLLAELKKGNSLAFRCIYEKYSNPLYTYGFNILKNEEECMDTVQDTFVWLWENRETLSITNLKSYLFTIIKYNLLWVIKRSKRRTELLSQHPFSTDIMVDEEFNVQELRRMITDFIETLPPKAKEVFLLSREDYLPHRQIAEQMGISEHTVRNQLATTLKKLKVYLAKISYWTIILLFFR